MTSSSQNGGERQSASSSVLDASAVLTVILNESGSSFVAGHIHRGACISASNLAEVVARLSDLGFSTADAVDACGSLGLDVIPFDHDQALVSAALRRTTREHGLGLGDRGCLALGRTLGLPVITADRSWSSLDVGVEVVLCR